MPVGDRPLLAYALKALAHAGVERVVANAYHLPDVLEEAVRECAPAGLSVSVVREERLLGTGGGIRNLRSHLEASEEPVIVFNADILFNPDLPSALELHRRLGAIATMIVRPDPRASSYGAIEYDGANRVRRLLGAPDDAEPLEMAMYTGVQILSQEALADLPEQGCIVRHAYRRWVDDGAIVGAFVDASPWRDLGTPEAYLQANLALAHDPSFVVGFAVEPCSAVHPSARVHPEARLERSVVGAGASVGKVHLERCVVWSGAQAHEDAIDTIIGVVEHLQIGTPAAMKH